MSASKGLGLVVLAFGLVASSASRCAAGGYLSQTSYAYGPGGSVRAAAVTIRTDHSAWQFIVPGSVLNKPVRDQVTLLNQRYNFGPDASIVEQVLQNMQQQRQQLQAQNRQQQLQNQQQQLQNQQQQQQQLQNQQQQQQQLQNQLQQQQQLQNQLNQIQQLARPPVPPIQPVIQPVMPPRTR
jgi:TolA-binding protein